jgi:hypothetical protein
MHKIALQRLHNQRLAGIPFDKPEEVVAWLGAVQAQEYALAKWALGQRTTAMTDDLVDQAFADGKILRTHVMRPTWHFVTPADIRWLLQLTAPRVHALNAYMYRKLELDESLLKRSNVVIAEALRGGQQLTRAELATALEQTGIAAEGMRLGYIVHYAELDAVVCSGPRHGKQFTYMLLDERAPQAKILAPDEALAELVTRFFTGHGPATVADFVWWSGLTVADANRGLEMAKSQLFQEVIDGKAYWYGASAPVSEIPSPTAYLLPPYDEFSNYRDHTTVLDSQYLDQAINATFGGFTVIDGKGVGNWRRTFKKGAVVIESAPFRRFTPAEDNAFAAAAQRFADFLEMSLVLA